MVSSHSPRHRSWYLAPITAVVLLLGSVAFAASASAQPNPGTPSQPTSGHAAKAQGPKAPASQGQGQGRTKPHRSSGAGHTSGGSAVNLSRPNGFQAQSDPDGMTNGGVDQPGGTGGVDTTTQDGNNGSGNDADCEDDNRGVGVPGHCKDRPSTPGEVTGDTPDTVDNSGTDTTGTTTDTSGTGTTPTDTSTVVLPGALVLPPSVGTGLATDQLTQVSAPTGSSVAGASTGTASQAAPGPVASILPNTGAGQALLALLVGGLAALTIGTGLLRRARATA
jgi:LPXTG-motif cell wall-anchored protein